MLMGKRTINSVQVESQLARRAVGGERSQHQCRCRRRRSRTSRHARRARAALAVPMCRDAPLGRAAPAAAAREALALRLLPPQDSAHRRWPGRFPRRTCRVSAPCTDDTLVLSCLCSKASRTQLAVLVGHLCST